MVLGTVIKFSNLARFRKSGKVPESAGRGSTFPLAQSEAGESEKRKDGKTPYKSVSVFRFPFRQSARSGKLLSHDNNSTLVVMGSIADASSSRQGPWAKGKAHRA
jgi:hypothetical protein